MVTKTAAKKAAAGKPSVKRFRALVERGEGSVCAISIDFDVEKTFGARGRVPVRGTLNGAPFRGSLFPMGGCHFMVVNRFLREAAGVTGGEFLRADAMVLPLNELHQKRLVPMQKRSYDAGEETGKQARYQWALLPLLLLLVYEILMAGGRHR